MDHTAATVDLDRYAGDGVAYPIPVLARAEAARHLALLEAFEAKYGAQAKAILRHKGHLVLTWLNALMRHPAIIAAVTRLIGPDVLCWTSNAFIKDPGDGHFVSWHQDATYWGLGTERIVTAWLALTPSTPENGCMRMVRGSHRWNQLPHRDTFHSANLLTRGQEIAVPVDEAQAEDIVLAPGEMSLHHVLIAHASGPNRSTGRRVGIAFRFITPDLAQSSGLRDSATLVAGEDRYGNFDLEPVPVRDMDPEAVALHRRVNEANVRILYRGAEDPADRLTPINSSVGNNEAT
jgi:ectoine hydroxylase-related dioxygenase (phytanoyl-CoA dioxygenase family)